MTESVRVVWLFYHPIKGRAYTFYFWDKANKALFTFQVNDFLRSIWRCCSTKTWCLFQPFMARIFWSIWKERVNKVNPTFPQQNKSIVGQQNKSIQRGRSSLFGCKWPWDFVWFFTLLKHKMDPFIHQRMVKFFLSPLILQKWKFVLFFLKPNLRIFLLEKQEKIVVVDHFTTQSKGSSILSNKN